MKMIMCALGLLILFIQFGAAAPLLQNNDVMTVCGDSITEVKIYSIYMEDYVLMCQPVKGVKTIQCGWGGTSASFLLAHMKDEALSFSPTVATTCYGMNDARDEGRFVPINAKVENIYRENMTQVVKKFKESGVRTIILGSPGVVDVDSFKKDNLPPEAYNQNLRRITEIAKEIAIAENVVFADVHTPMMDVMTKSKAKLGDRFFFAGGDGQHPLPAGHLIMAYAFLKALGFDGNIGTITYDAGSGKAEATDGHKVVSSKVGEIAIESTRYPFCFSGEPNDFRGTSIIVPFTTFNEELNRYLLVVKNLKSPKAKITWGAESKEFTAEQLGKGINLAAEFLKNPFVIPFQKVEQVIRAKQEFETTYIKGYLSAEKMVAQSAPTKGAAIKEFSTSYRKVHNELLENCAESVKPVTHTIKIEEAK